ncbi:MFS transporter [Cytobacillus sp. FSL R5-0596]|uniref:MFS transporter n=1 Tax=Cytobacillus sp. FSL R5-0596 TaxID=2954696 RepID=UPI0030FA4EED
MLDKTLLKDPVWKNRNFLILWLSQSVSFFGNQIFILGMPLFIYEITGSGSKMALVYAFTMMPYVVFGILGGGIADYFDRRRILFIGNILVAVPLFIMNILFYMDSLLLWSIFIFVFIISSFEGIILSTFEATIPSLVKRSELVSANSLFELSNSAIYILGPMLGGIIIASFSPTVAIIINAFSFLIAGTLIYLIKPSGNPVKNTKRSVKNSLHNFWEGVLYLPKHRVLRWGMLISTGTNIVLGAFTVMLIFHLKTVLNFSADTIGIVLTVASISSLISSGFIAKQLSHFHKGTIMIISVIFMGVGVIGIGFSTNIILLLLMQFIYMGCMTLYTINWRTLRQEITPESMLGRVSGVSRGIAFSGASIGGFLSSFVISEFPTSTLFLIQGLFVMFIGMIAITSPLSHIKKNQSKDANLES